MWGCIAKVLLPDLKKRKIVSKTSDCMFIGYAQQSSAYRFLVLKRDILDHNTIVETKDAEFFENIFPLKDGHIPKRVGNSSFQNEDDSFENLRRSKRQRKETSFGDDFYTYLIQDEPKNFYEAVSSPEAKFWKDAIKNELDSLNKNQTWVLVDLPPGAKPIGCKWVFKKKYFPDGSIDKYKVRLVAKGFTQK